MTGQEKINAEVQTKLAVQDEKFEAFLREMKDFKDEMRDRDNRRATENEELRSSIKEIYQTTDAKVDSIRQSIQTMQNQNIVVIIGVIAIAVAVFLK